MAGLEGLLNDDSGQVLKPERMNEALMTVAGATLRETLVSNPGASIARAAELGFATYDPSKPRMSAEEARTKIKADGFDGQLLVPDSGITPEALNILIERKHDERLRQEIFDNAPSGAAAGALNLSMAFAGSLTDPLNVASAFIPIVGEERAAALLGKSAGVLRRTAVRAGVGAVEGTVGAAAVEPFTYLAKRQEQADYDMGNSLLNIGFGGVFGAGLHVGGGALGDAWRYARGSAGDMAERVDAQTRAQVLKSAIAQSVNGERVNVEPILGMDPRSQANYIERAASLSPEDRAVESRFADSIQRDVNGHVDRYAQIPETKGGNVINTDIVRELSPDYLADRSKAAAVHEPASFLTKEIYRRKLEQAQPGGEVVFAAGGAGSGKSTGLDLLGIKDKIVYDGTLSKFKSATKVIDQALDAKQTARVVFTYRDPAEAFKNGVLPRSMREEKKFGTGRTVPLEAFEHGHRGARETISQLMDHYKDNERVRFEVIDNSRGPGEARIVDLDSLPATDYNGARGKINSILEDARRSGAISEPVYHGTRGGAPEVGSQRARSADRGQPEPQRAQQGPDPVAGSLDRVRQAAEAPKLSTVADEQAAEAGTAALKADAKILERGEAPTADDIQAINDETSEILASLKADGVDVESALADADQLVKDADTYAKAARAAVVCGLNHA